MDGDDGAPSLFFAHAKQYGFGGVFFSTSFST